MDSTLIVFTADHGEDLGEHNGYYYHGCSIYRSTLDVPLGFVWPGVLRAASEMPSLSQTVDVLPTLFDLCGWPLLADFEGVSFLPHLAGAAQPPRVIAIAEWQDLILYVRSQDASYVWNPKGAHPRKPPYTQTDASYAVDCEELYDLRRDPAESQNRAPLVPQELPAWRRLAGEHARRPGAERAWRGIQDERVLANLRAMGYAGSEDERYDVWIGARDCGGR